MSGVLLLALSGVGLLVIGLWSMVVQAHLVRKVLAANVAVSGGFMILMGIGAMSGPGVDPVPQAMVITGIVVAVSATALALALVVRIALATGAPALSEDQSRDLTDTGQG